MTRREQILKVLGNTDVPQTAREVSKRVGMTPSAAQTILSKLVFEGPVACDTTITPMKYRLIEERTPTAKSGRLTMTFEEFNFVVGLLELTFEDAFEIFKSDTEVQEAMAHVCSRLLVSMKHTIVKNKKEK